MEEEEEAMGIQDSVETPIELDYMEVDLVTALARTHHAEEEDSVVDVGEVVSMNTDFPMKKFIDLPHRVESFISIIYYTNSLKYVFCSHVFSF